MAVAGLGFAASLAALLHPQVRAAFGLPPRRRGQVRGGSADARRTPCECRYPNSRGGGLRHHPLDAGVGSRDRDPGSPDGAGRIVRGLLAAGVRFHPPDPSARGRGTGPEAGVFRGVAGPPGAGYRRAGPRPLSCPSCWRREALPRGHARSGRAAKRGGGQAPVPLDTAAPGDLDLPDASTPSTPSSTGNGPWLWPIVPWKGSRRNMPMSPVVSSSKCSNRGSSGATSTPSRRVGRPSHWAAPRTRCASPSTGSAGAFRELVKQELLHTVSEPTAVPDANSGMVEVRAMTPACRGPDPKRSS